MAFVMRALSDAISKIFVVEIMHDVTFVAEIVIDLWNGSRSNENMLIESPYVFDCNRNVCHISHHFQAICRQSVQNLDHTFRMGQDQM